MSNILIIDGAYLLKGAAAYKKKFDYIKTRDVLAKAAGAPFKKSFFLNSAKEIEKDKTGPFFDFMTRSGYDVMLYQLKEWEIECPFCKKKHVKMVQKGVDVGVATSLMKCAIDNSCEKVVLAAGDGDLGDAVSYLVTDAQKKLIVAGYENTVSGILQSYAEKVVWLNEHWSEIEKTF